MYFIMPNSRSLKEAFDLLKNPLFSSILVRISLVFLELVPCLILIFCFLSMLHVVRSYECTVLPAPRQNRLRFNHRVWFKIEEKSN